MSERTQWLSEITARLEAVKAEIPYEKRKPKRGTRDTTRASTMSTNIDRDEP